MISVSFVEVVPVVAVVAAVVVVGWMAVGAVVIDE